LKLKFLGTSYGAPQKNRHCQSILIETDSGNSYLFDTGAPVLDILKNNNYDVKKIKSIFISHLHGDHINGLLDIINLTDFYEMNYSIYLPEQRGIEAVKAYSDMQTYGFKSDRIKYHLITENLFYNDSNLKITAYKTKHMENTSDYSFGFLIEADNKKIFITGDLHPTLKDFPDFLYNYNINLLITECAHFNIEQLFEKIKNCKTDKTAVIHVYPPEKYKQLKKHRKKLPFKLILPNDNDFIKF